MGQRADDQRCAGLAGCGGDAGEFVFGGAGELQGDVALVFGKDVDGEMVGRAEGLQAGGLERKAPQDQGWVERDGVEGGGRDAEALAFAGALSVAGFTTCMVVSCLTCSARGAR